MLTVIGSRALMFHTNIDRVLNDLDLVGTYKEVMDFANKFGTIRECYPIDGGKKYIIKLRNQIIEAEIAWEGTLAEELCKLVEDQYGYAPGCSSLNIEGLLVPSLDILYMLKMSHRYLKNSPHFLKTMRDIQKMRENGAVIRPEHVDFYKKRVKETYWYNHPNLSVKKDAFFTGDGVQYIYDHDTIHLAMALDPEGKPAYKFYQPKDSEVNVSKDLFYAQPEQIRLFGVLEEALVLALERSQIPYNFKPAPKASFDMALMKVCTSITSGWFRTYSWEHYDEVQALYPSDYVDRFTVAVGFGLVKPYKGI